MPNAFTFAEHQLTLYPSAHGMSITVPDLAQANQYVQSSVDKYSACFNSYAALATAYTTVAGPVGDAYRKTVAFSTSWPEMVMSGVMLVVGAVLMLYGYKLVRPVNLAAGAYLGFTGSLILLQIFATSIDSCYVTMGVATGCAVLLGVACAAKRSSVLVVLGIVLGEIVGDNFYKLFLAAYLPEYVAFGCIGFFAVLLAVLLGHVGDFAVKLACAFFGAYMFTCNLTKLVLVPYVPGGAAFNAFLTYKPDVAKAIVLSSDVVTPLIGSPYVYGPVLGVALLTAIGTTVQVRMLRSAQGKDMH